MFQAHARESKNPRDLCLMALHCVSVCASLCDTHHIAFGVDGCIFYLTSSRCADVDIAGRLRVRATFIAYVCAVRS